MIMSLVDSFIFSDASLAPSSSPSSFARQEIRDSPFDLIDMSTQEITSEGNHSIDIRGVNYYSDGKTLNATIWLNSSFNKTIVDDADTVSYGMYIDTDSNKETGWQGVDYQMEIQWNNEMQTWIKIIVEYSSQGYSRYLDIIQNQTDFVDELNANYVLLSLDLEVLTSPIKYETIFYAQVTKDSIQKIDFTNWVHIPPPDFTISTSPNHISLRPGEKENIELKINSTTGFEPKVNLYSENRTNGIELKFTPSELSMPSYGTVASPSQVRVPTNASPGQYTIFAFANGTFESESVESLMENDPNVEDTIAIPTSSENLTESAGLTVTVQEPLTFEEKLTSFWSSYGDPMNFVYGIAAGLAPWAYVILKKKFSKNKRSLMNDDY